MVDSLDRVTPYGKSGRAGEFPVVLSVATKGGVGGDNSVPAIPC